MLAIDWSFIDRVVYINLKKRTDRNEAMQKELGRVGVPEEKIVRFEAVERENGGMGCTLSHAGVLAMAECNQWPNVLILEDDMMFNEDDESCRRINDFFLNLQGVPWDVGFLSASYYIIKKIKQGFYKVEFAYLANSYLVNRPYYKRLMRNFHESAVMQQNGVPYDKSSLDYHWLQLMAKDRWYGIYPCSGYQNPDVSDIEKKMMDRMDSFTRHIDEIKKYGSF
ncbi:glycosyl hydrolase family 25 [Pantoea sp. BAV 3049]|uniref:glycosyl hydrolase family 25 n=1 Tax=Pantoea sp. BAV 3049 TaxID=2654188 RepID=UPI00131D0C55|nr:glycosyl hydrolase family 25 [Pantoea sp. BAV 3049]